MYVIVGATGNTGSVVAEKLLGRGEKVRAIGRNKEKLEKLTSKGAEAATGELTDVAFLTKAFDGARAVYFMVPPNPTSDDYRGFQREVIEAGATAYASSAGITTQSDCVNDFLKTNPVRMIRNSGVRLSVVPQ